MNPLRITDTTFRDGHQSLIATRLRMEDMEPIAADMGAIGFHSMEVWGGATFDTATRYLAEDPWERLRTFKRLIPDTPLSMLLRGQSLVGYRNYADDVVEAFVQRAADTGIDVFRVFDALNDERNVATAARAVKKAGKHLQATICYSVTEAGKLGGPIYNLDYYVERAQTLVGLGAHSLAVKDMAGLLAPYDAYELFGALKDAVDVPLQLHTHYTSGMASMSCVKAVEAGADVIDAALAPLALRTSQPAVEPLVTTFRGTDRDTGLDLDKLLEMGDHLESVLPKYREHMENSKAAVIDAKVLSHQIPGGMASNLTAQLRQAGAIDRLDEVLEEIPRTRRELGYPPLVTPLSQMVGTQAVMNVLFGRYKMIGDEIRDYVYGLYGTPPAPLDEDVVSNALSGYKNGQTPITVRPGDLLEPELDAAADAVKDISDDLDDVLVYALYPTTGMKFLRIKHGLDPVPDEMKPEPAARTAKWEIGTPRKLDGAPTPKSGRSRSFNIHLDGEVYQVEVDPVSPSAAPPTKDDAGAASGRGVDGRGLNGAVIEAPMPGIVTRYEVEEGQHVEAGDTIVVLEAMNMENTLAAPSSGSVKSLEVSPGASVAKGDVLAVVDP